MLQIRPSQDGDIAAITTIYAHHVLHGTGTFEIDPPTEADMAQRRADVLARGLPWLVAERDGQVLGFAYANWFKPRPAYRFTAEDSIYVADAARGSGVGREAFRYLRALDGYRSSFSSFSARSSLPSMSILPLAPFA